MDFDKKAEEIQSSFEDDGWVGSCSHRRLYEFLANFQLHSSFQTDDLAETELAECFLCYLHTIRKKELSSSRKNIKKALP